MLEGGEVHPSIIPFAFPFRETPDEPPRPSIPQHQELIDESPFYSRANERYLRAELLASLGQPREALRWYGSFAAHSSYDLLYLGPGYLRRGEIYEELGEPQAAADNYARFIELWKDCDPELRPLLERGERGLERVLERSG